MWFPEYLVLDVIVMSSLPPGYEGFQKVHCCLRPERQRRRIDAGSFVAPTIITLLRWVTVIASNYERVTIISCATP